MISALLLIVLILAFNAASLASEVSTETDESYHIFRVVCCGGVLVDLVRHSRLGVAAFISAAVVFFCWPARLGRHWRLLAILAALVALLPLTPKLAERLPLLVRYPFVSVWLHMAGPVWPRTIYDAGLYRVFPLISIFGLGWFLLTRLRAEGLGSITAFVMALAFVLTPTICFFTTEFYLEPTALLLLTIGFFSIEPILTEDFRTVRRLPGWYALLAFGFIKETLIAIVAAIILLRWAVQFSKKIPLFNTQHTTHNKQQTTNYSQPVTALLSEITFSFCLGAPLAIYMFFHMFYDTSRPYPFIFRNLLHLRLYAQLGAALADQYRGLIPLALGGVLVALSRRRFVLVASLLFIAFADTLFHFVDFDLFIGNIRFNLMLFAILAVFAVLFLGWAARLSRPLALACALGCLALCLVRPPVSPLSGDNAWDGRFPHDKALRWIAANRPGAGVVFDRIDKSMADWYLHAARVTLAKYDGVRVDPRTSSREGLHLALAAARREGCTLVLHHMGEKAVLPAEEFEREGFRAIAVFPNRYRAIVIYELAKNK